MGIACKIAGHKWSGCTCARCGERRDEGHDWHVIGRERRLKGGGAIRECVSVCSICGRWLPAEHDWQGCVCARCGERRDEGHDWQGCKCARCGKTRDESHVWGKARPVVPNAHSGHHCPCTVCGTCSEDEPHSLKKVPGCRYRCAECGYTTIWHDFRNGVCADCGLDESEHYCELILSGKVRYDAWEYSPLDGSRMQAIDHVSSVGALRRIALADKDGIYSSCKMACARKLGDIAKAGGADSHNANLALRDLVLKADLGWDTPMVAGWITDSDISSDPKVVEAVRRVEKASVEYDNAMIALDSGIGRSG